MTPFVHQGHPARVVFGVGARRNLVIEVTMLGIGRPLLIGDAARGCDALAPVEGFAVGSITDVVMHVPIERAQAARALATRVNADGLVVVGGGSALGLAKAIALESGLPIVAVPTTYAGSEMTSIWGLTEAGEKKTGRDDRVRPRTVIYDPELTASMPQTLAATSGLNALAHSMEALYAPGVDPIVLLMAEESIRALSTHLPGVAPGDVEASSGVLYGAWLAGVCLDRTTAGLHHKLCHVLGGSFGLPHAETHAVVLPHAAAYNAEAAPEAMRLLARALGSTDGPSGLFDLAERIGAPRSLAALGMRESDLERAVVLATEKPYPNPRPVDQPGVRALLADAFAGRRPQRT